ncbi:MAG: radical SAM protein [Clostridia bacterium]|nr:radical SAM protein [Clostridia bacterium]
MLLTSLLRILLTRSFKAFTFKGRYSNQLNFASMKNLGLYVHIPFCKSICSFCPYCKELYDEKLALRYKDTLMKEIDLVCKGMRGKKAVTSLYFGGGTPTLLIDSLSEIIQKLKEYFEINDGVGVEIHPDEVTDEILGKLQNAGVSMVSIGVQSFNEECLQKLGRKHIGIEEKLSLLKKYSFSVIDMDLIFGIPGQDKQTLKNDIETAFRCGATQISTYPFIDFTFANNEYKPLSHKEKRVMLEYLNELCSKPEINRTSVWTFAKSKTGKYSSVTRDTFLGFGVSATTLLQDIFKINTFSVQEYINRVYSNNLPTALTLNFTKRQRAVYYLFWSAYSLHINGDAFERLIGKPITKMFGIEFFIAKKLGLLIKENNTYYLTNKAAYIYHYLEQKYTTAYIDKMWNISRKIAFPEKIELK